MKLYTPLVIKALNFAHTAHFKQKDKAGAPYILHPIMVASEMDTEEETCAALLHDVCEDTPVVLADLEKLDMPENVINLVALLSKNVCRRKDGGWAMTYKGYVNYEEYMDRIFANPTALKIKVADIRHNLHPSRISMLPEEEQQRLKEKYKKWHSRLCQQLGFSYQQPLF